MGYTHYQYQKNNFTQKQWEKICLDFLKIEDYCEKNKIALAYECDIPQPPKVDDELIRFNGVGNEGHETFILHKKKPAPQPWMDSKEYFSFCKTAHKPYDMAVGLVLLCAAKHAPKTISISSDGDWDHDWAGIRREYEKIFGSSPECPFAKEQA
jgi:hypothetical protein